ncbi:ATP-binding protein [Exiguobacterium sp. s193]|uniref:ATP-binding protein n=1 Tax=Exiguobacterium sp. s193 TaxID=2751207 RepID=UPI001BECBC79|nr:ATP-binding protein [Exiguobacterium sp. s193]
MDNIERLIRYEREGSKLDFKQEQYHRMKYPELIKDIMSMANVPSEGKRYIVIGVKDHLDGTKEFFSIPSEEIVDQATFQQIIRENIEPTIDFSYYPFEFDGNLLGVIEIDNCINAPYMMKKDYGNLKKGDCFIRNGSQQSRMIRRDYDEIERFKLDNFLGDKIEIGFDKDFDSRLRIEGVRNAKFPSEEVKAEIESILSKRTNPESTTRNKTFGGISSGFPNIYSPFRNIPYEERSTEDLKKYLENIEEKYLQHDWYYMGEEKAEKINLTVVNRGNKYLEDVLIMLEIPIDSGDVMEELIDKPKPNEVISIAANPFNSAKLYYPHVEKKSDVYTVQQNIGSLKHQLPMEVFNEDLRVFFGENVIGKSFKWSYTIYAKNLSNPINGELIIDIV